MGEELEGEGGGDFLDSFVAEDDFFEEACFFARCGSSAGEGVVYQELERFSAVFVGGVFDLCDDFGGECAVVDGQGLEALSFAVFDLGEVVEVEAHLMVISG